MHRLPDYADWIWLGVTLVIVVAVAVLAREIHLADQMAMQMRG
jgi:hypothetical protein